MHASDRLRRHSRLGIHAKVRLSWILPDGTTPQVLCDAVDISSSGMRVISKEPVPVRQYVYVQSPEIHLSGQASVRSCNRAGMRYLLGLEFSGGLKWSPPESATACTAAEGSE